MNKIKPFWSWNDKLEIKELERQIELMKKSGIEGFFMHARGGLETEYLSEDWFRAVEASVDEAEKRGIRTDKGEVNRQIVADNKLLKEIKARITRLYRWSKAEAEKPQTQQSSLTALWEAQQQLNAPRTRTGKIRALQESAALFSFLQANGIQSMQQLHEKIADMNSCYYDLRGKIVKAERRIAILTERGEMWEQYNQYKSIHKQLAKVKPEKREQFEQRHSRELILYDAAARYLKELKDSGEAITMRFSLAKRIYSLKSNLQ